MADQNSLSSMLDLIPTSLEKVQEILAGVGIVLPPFLLQAFMLVIDLVLLVVLLRQARRGTTKLPALMASVTLALVAFGVLYSWSEQWLNPLPREIAGLIETAGKGEQRLWSRMRLSVLDFHHQKISGQDGLVDTSNGRFALPYEASFGVRPRYLRVTISGCKEMEYSIGRGELRQGTVSILYKCGGPQ
jgi:hypothetical protein